MLEVDDAAGELCLKLSKTRLADPPKARTAWLWCRDEMRQSVDYLVIDEAGQISLADALALSTAGTNLILLGDPQQLAQVSQGTHPPGSGVSV